MYKQLITEGFFTEESYQGYFNRNYNNLSIIRAVIVAGYYPDIAVENKEKKKLIYRYKLCRRKYFLFTYVIRIVGIDIKLLTRLTNFPWFQRRMLI